MAVTRLYYCFLSLSFYWPGCHYCFVFYPHLSNLSLLKYTGYSVCLLAACRERLGRELLPKDAIYSFSESVGESGIITIQILGLDIENWHHPYILSALNLFSSQLFHCLTQLICMDIFDFDCVSVWIPEAISMSGLDLMSRSNAPPYPTWISWVNNMRYKIFIYLFFGWWLFIYSPSYYRNVVFFRSLSCELHL